MIHGCRSCLEHCNRFIDTLGIAGQGTASPDLLGSQLAFWAWTGTAGGGKEGGRGERVRGKAREMAVPVEAVRGLEREERHHLGAWPTRYQLQQVESYCSYLQQHTCWYQ